MCVLFHAVDYLKNENDINVHESTVQQTCSEHMHDFVEMGFVLSGKGVHIINQQAFPICEGDMFLLNAQVPHEFISENGQPLNVRNCLFRPLGHRRTGNGTRFLRAAALQQYFFTAGRSGGGKRLSPPDRILPARYCRCI